MLSKHVIYVSGLPRSGSTLLCRLLGQHPEIFSSGHSSPVAHAIDALRRRLSDDPFLLAQLDVDFEAGYSRLAGAMRGMIDGWFAGEKQPYVVDKNRGWLAMVETVAQLDPDFRMLVSVRELVQLYGSIESRHQRTILLDFPDHLADRSRYARADSLFSTAGVIGRPLRSLQSVQDLPNSIRERLFFVIFEDLSREPVRVLNEIVSWLGLPRADFDVETIARRRNESDSYYRFKYSHDVHGKVAPPQEHAVPQRIARSIRDQFAWFYKTFYPGT